MRIIESSDALTITIGENADENQNLCKRARQNDLWFHLDGQPSPHAILTAPAGKKMSDTQIRQSIHEASQLVKYFSSARYVYCSASCCFPTFATEPFLKRYI